MLRVITMPGLSQGVSLVWRLAANETTRTMYPCIEKEFILIGLCDLGRWLRSKAQGDAALLKGRTRRAVSAEAQTIEKVLQACAVVPDLVCHAVRTVLGKGSDKRCEGIVHRSTACKACFQQAEAIAQAAGAAEVH